MTTMKLSDVRKIAVKQQARVRFALDGGMECVVDEHLVARVPGLSGPPSFNLEDEFSRAVQFSVQGAGGTRQMSRGELEKLASAQGGGAGAFEEHDE